MTIESIVEGSGLNALNAAKTDKKTRSESASPGDGKQAVRDRVQFSDNARILSERDEFIRQAAGMLSQTAPEEDRGDLIARVMERLENGYYDEDKVIAEVARMMIEGWL
jgi:hypothetical protein